MREQHPPKGRYFEHEYYEIRIQGHLHDRWTRQFEGLTVTRETDGTTRLFGPLPDQTALHSILLRIRNMNLKLISAQLVGGIDLDFIPIQECITPEDMKSALLRIIHEVRNQGNLEAWDELVAPEYIEHLYPFGNRDFNTARDTILKMHSALSDRSDKVDEILVTEDRVILRWTTRGTHTSEIFSIPPTGKIIETTGCAIYRLEAGKIIEAFVYEDWLGLFQQMGVIPPIGQKANT